MTPYGMSRRSAVGGGIILLLYEVFGVYGIESIPKITLCAVAFMTGIHLDLLPQFHTPVPLSPVAVINGNFNGLLLGPLFHGDDLHLYYNMVSLIWKGRKLEQSYGALNFVLLLLVLTLGSSLTFVGLSYLAADYFEDQNYLHTRAIGFSGVLFALKVIAGERNPISLSTWAELILIQLAVPNASFLGHLAGLLFGIGYVLNPFSSLIRSAQKSISKYHLLSIVITLIGFHYNDSHSSMFNTIKNFFSYSHSMCINSRTRNWHYFITAPLKYRDHMDYLLLFISFPIKLSLIESFRGTSKAWVSVLISFLGTSTMYYLSCCYLRLEKLPFLREECAYGLGGPLFALKTAVFCIMLFGGIDYPHFIFELIEAYFLLMNNEPYNLYHLSGTFVGLIIYGWLRSLQRQFRGRGQRLGRRGDPSPVRVRSSRATKSWGYGDYDRDSVVRRRTREEEEEEHRKEYIEPEVLSESLRTFYAEEEARRTRRSVTPSPSAPPPDPTYPPLHNPPPPTSVEAYSSGPSAPPEEEVMDIDDDTEMEICSNHMDEIREKRINKFG